MTAAARAVTRVIQGRRDIDQGHGRIGEKVGGRVGRRHLLRNVRHSDVSRYGVRHDRRREIGVIEGREINTVEGREINTVEGQGREVNTVESQGRDHDRRESRCHAVEIRPSATR